MRAAVGAAVAVVAAAVAALPQPVTPVRPALARQVMWAQPVLLVQELAQPVAVVVAADAAMPLAQAPAMQPTPVTPQPKPAAAVVVAADSAAVAAAAAPRSNPASTPSHSANWPERISLPWASPRKWKSSRSKPRTVKATALHGCSLRARLPGGLNGLTY
jgi:hypothetical protein